MTHFLYWNQNTVPTILCLPLFQELISVWNKCNNIVKHKRKLEKKYAPTLDNYGQSCFARSDFLKMKCVCKTQMMPTPVNMHTSIMCINILQNIEAVALKL